jgi:hypothetical protein
MHSIVLKFISIFSSHLPLSFQCGHFLRIFPTRLLCMSCFSHQSFIYSPSYSPSRDYPNATSRSSSSCNILQIPHPSFLLDQNIFLGILLSYSCSSCSFLKVKTPQFTPIKSKSQITVSYSLLKNLLESTGGMISELTQHFQNLHKEASYETSELGLTTKTSSQSVVRLT